MYIYIFLYERYSPSQTSRNKNIIEKDDIKKNNKILYPPPR